MFKARFAGGADVAFGVDPLEATQRLRKILNIVRSMCKPKQIDVALDRAERRAESVANKAAKRSVRYNPHRG
jgi:hypothetical protein